MSEARHRRNQGLGYRATDLVLCADLLTGRAIDAETAYRIGLVSAVHPPENMGLRTSQMLGTFFEGVSRHTEEAHRWVESFEEKGFRQVIRERDAPWQDYGERPGP